MPPNFLYGLELKNDNKGGVFESDFPARHGKIMNEREWYVYKHENEEAPMEDTFARVVRDRQSRTSVFGMLDISVTVASVMVGVLALYSALVTILVIGGNSATGVGVSAAWSPVWQSNSCEMSGLGMGIMVLGWIRNHSAAVCIGMVVIAMGLSTQIYAMVALGGNPTATGLFATGTGVRGSFNVTSLNYGGVDEGLYAGGQLAFLWICVITSCLVVLVMGGMTVYALAQMEQSAYGSSETFRKPMQLYPFAPNGPTAMHKESCNGRFFTVVMAYDFAWAFAILCAFMVFVDWTISLSAMSSPPGPQSPTGWDLCDNPRFCMIVAIGMTVMAPAPLAWGIDLTNAVSRDDDEDGGRPKKRVVRKFERRHCRGRPFQHTCIGFVAVMGLAAAWTHYVALVRNLTTDNGEEYVHLLQQTALGTSYAPPSGGCYLNRDCYDNLPWFRHGSAQIGPWIRRSSYGYITFSHHVVQLLILLFGTMSLTARLGVWLRWAILSCVGAKASGDGDEKDFARYRARMEKKKKDDGDDENLCITVTRRLLGMHQEEEEDKAQ